MKLTTKRVAAGLVFLAVAATVIVYQVVANRDSTPVIPTVTADLSLGEAAERRFAANDLEVGDRFPAVDVFDADGNPLNTRDLVGQYTVLVSGCLT